MTNVQERNWSLIWFQTGREYFNVASKEVEADLKEVSLVSRSFKVGRVGPADVTKNVH